LRFAAPLSLDEYGLLARVFCWANASYARGLDLGSTQSD
jgi:hypothetical protein